MKAKITNILSWLITALLLVLIDQYTKFLATAGLKGKPPLVIREGVFELLYSENRGAAFGMLQGRQTFFFVIAVVVLAAAGYAMYRMPGWHNRRYHGLKLCVILITAGAAGNMTDRMAQGFVVDFLYFSLIDFPVFNVADIYVTTAAAVLFLLICFYYKEEDMDIFRWRKPLHKEDLK